MEKELTKDKFIEKVMKSSRKEIELLVNKYILSEDIILYILEEGNRLDWSKRKNLIEALVDNQSLPDNIIEKILTLKIVSKYNMSICQKISNNLKPIFANDKNLLNCWGMLNESEYKRKLTLLGYELPKTGGWIGYVNIPISDTYEHKKFIRGSRNLQNLIFECDETCTNITTKPSDRKCITIAINFLDFDKRGGLGKICHDTKFKILYVSILGKRVSWWKNFEFIPVLPQP